MIILPAGMMPDDHSPWNGDAYKIILPGVETSEKLFSLEL